MSTSEFPGLEVVARQAIRRAEQGLPPDVGVALLLAYHSGPHEGGFAYVTGVTRESSISLVCEWLAHQARDEGHGATVLAALEHWFTTDRAGSWDPHKRDGS